jgi:hypothetical protein
MRKILLASVAVLALAGTTAVYARHGGPGHHHHARINPEDRAAFADARIAAVKAGLKLTPDQEKLWPPVEAAVRDFAKLRIDRANARMEERRNDRSDDARRSETPDNPVTRLQKRADAMAATAAAMKKIAETADPLYRTLDDGQKRRLSILTRMDGGPHGEGWHHRGGRDFDRDNDRGPDRDGPRRFERDRDRGPERL